MNYLKIFSLLFFLFFSNILFAQSPKLLKSEGKIPKDFITKSTVKYKKQVKELSGDKNRSRKKNKKEFLLQSNFSIDDILQSGMVLFNDPATTYINDVLKKLPVENKKLIKRKPRAYVLNSNAVNAFATDQGIIFVTLGLLAKLENEAQLAFILSHELMHIQHRHSIDKFVKAKNIDKKGSRKKNADKVSIDRSIFKNSMYSQKLEMEADEDGLELFLKSEYNPSVILNIFEILHYAYLPFDNQEFDKVFFQDENYIFPPKTWLSSVKDIEKITALTLDKKVKEEKESSHPSSQERLAKLKDRIRNINGEHKKSFLISEKIFFDIRDKARYQLSFLSLYDENFPEAIYTSFLNLQKNPNDLELQKVIGKSLYMAAKYKNASYEFDVDYSDIEGESQQLYYLISKMKKKDLTILALKYNFNLHLKNEKDKELEILTNDLFLEFASHFEDLEDFETAPSTPPIQSDSTANEGGSIYWKYAFIQQLENDDFKKLYDKALDKLQKQEELTEYYETNKGENELRKQLKKERRKGKSLGIKKIVVVNPFFLSLDARKNNVVQYLRGEKKQEYFSSRLLKFGKKAKVETTLLDVTELSNKEVDVFNDISEINHYFSQQMDHFDLSLTPSYNQNKINKIAEKYGTEYFLWTGVISLREKNNYKSLLFGIIAPYVLPLLIPNVVRPNYDMLYYAILFDIKTGKRSIIKMEYFDHRDSKSILNAHIYDVYHQIGK